MAKNKHSSINLLPQEEFDASLLGRTLIWAMGSFRIIVILTEMVVMVAFLSRFWLDAQNSDLSDSIKIASAQISAQSQFEKEFRGVQQKIETYKQIVVIPAPSTHIDAITNKVPGEVVLTSINAQDNSAQIKGSSLSEFGVAQFISNLQADKTFKTVELQSLGTTDQNQSIITFFLNVGY